MSRCDFATTCVILAIAASVSSAERQESQSAEAAATLIRLLHERNLQTVAARDPEQTGRFVAALYFPGSLLVISSTYPVPAVLEQRLAEQQYRDVYTDLHGAGLRDGRVFVTDLQANGLRRTREPDEPFDIVYRNGGDQCSYDGDWKEQQLTESQYNERFREDDAQYAHMLNVLVNALRGPAT
jgi:hypothetical protein